ncbi:DUF5071 domain-containing protein [Mucilaginibacter sp. AK015]|uniref:DUF5071 domain-containing protein n=1 Tax=Mucilaginibacter sp. AK015 TaxID=2723072 RepID=UPI0016087896|nr:DUF5071 domain-containing protein [Mucilaginibacter sp. AK015]MBB5397171.1 hypothetical protein [Mucilaginibacter sp. AK015]
MKKNHIPQNIYDVTAVEHLLSLPFDAVKSDVPELLTWLQDMHWPVADGIADYLVPHVNDITDELISILQTDDSLWKYYIMRVLIARSHRKLQPGLIKVIKYLAENPSEIDVDDNVDEAAKEILANKLLCDQLD